MGIVHSSSTKIMSFVATPSPTSALPEAYKPGTRFWRFLLPLSARKEKTKKGKKQKKKERKEKKRKEKKRKEKKILHLSASI